MTRSLRIAPSLIVGANLLVWIAGFVMPPVSGEDEQRIVATAGTVEITVEEFRREYTAYLLATGIADHTSHRRSFLDDLVAARLLIAEERAGGIQHDAAFQTHLANVERGVLLDAYLQHVLFDTLRITDADLREMFVRANTHVQARHLYAPTFEEAMILHARLQAGERFEDLAHEVFNDPELAESGGSVGTFGFDEMDPAFEEAAFTLQIGEISEPVRTAQGYSIIQVEHRFTQPLLTETAFAAQKDRLRPYVRARKQQQARRDHLYALQNTLHITFHDDGLQSLLGHVTGQALIPGDEAFDTWLRQPLVTFGPEHQRGTWTLATFRDQARHTSTEQRAHVQSEKHLIDFITGLVLREAMLTRARQAALDASPSFTEAVRATIDEWVLTTARNRLADEVSVPADSINAYYATAPRSEFQVPAKVRVREIVTATLAEAEQVKEQLAHASFESLAPIYSMQPDTREVGGDLGFLSRDQLGALGDLVFEAEVDTVLGPLDVQGRYVLLKIEERLPARPMTEDEARTLIHDQLLYRMTRAHLQATYAALRARHTVHIDTELLYSIPLTNGQAN